MRALRNTLVAVLTILGCERSQPRSARVIEPIDVSYDLARGSTVVSLPSGRSLQLDGKYALRKKFWTDSSTIWTSEFSIWALTSSSNVAQLMHEGRRKDCCNCPGPVFSADGQKLFAWLESKFGLTSIDVASGEKVSLARLPTHFLNYEGFKHYDPAPVLRGPAVAEAGIYLLTLLQEESNEEVPDSEVSDRRQGGHYLAFLRRSNPNQVIDTQPTRQLAGKALSWAWSTKRKELFILGTQDEVTRLGIYRLNGELVRNLDAESTKMATCLRLAPSEDRLLIERTSADAKAGGGFLIWDLASESLREGADRGWSAAWSPVGDRIAYLDEWRLTVFDCATGARRVLVSHEPPVLEPAPSEAQSVSWSRDGARIAVNFGGYRNRFNDKDDVHTLFLDLVSHDFLLVDDPCDAIVWSRSSHPIGAR